MRLSPDQLVFWQHGFIKLNSTIVTTWALMLLTTIGAHLITRKLTSDVTTFTMAGRPGNSRQRYRRADARKWA